MLPAIIEMWRGLHFRQLNFENIPPWRCQVSQQISFRLLLPECLLRPADILQQAPDTDSWDWETETKFLVKGSKNSLTETFAWECSVLVIENLNFDNLPVWISHLRASAFCGSLAAAFWCGSVCSCFLKLSRCKRRTCPISAVQMEFCQIAFHPQCPLFLPFFFTWGLP